MWLEVRKLLGVGAGFGVKKDQSQEDVVKSRKIENIEYYCDCGLPFSYLCLITPFQDTHRSQLVAYKGCVYWPKGECKEHLRKREETVTNCGE